MVVYSSTKFRKYSGRYQRYRADTIFIRNKSKGHNSVTNVGGLSVLILCTLICLIVVYISANFHENILDSITVIEQT